MISALSPIAADLSSQWLPDNPHIHLYKEKSNSDANLLFLYKWFSLCNEVFSEKRN